MPVTEPGTVPPPAILLANGLKWLTPEIDASLHRVRSIIDVHADAEDGLVLDTRVVLDELKLVRGALAMASCHGGYILAAELCATVEVIALGKLERPAEALAALSGATLQLSDYLDALQNDAADRAAVLQPAISELRLATGRVAATEADLFMQQMLLLDFSLPVPAEPPRPIGAAMVIAAKLQAAFQALLLQWLKGIDVPNTLLKLRKVGDHIASNASKPDVVLLWSVYAAAVDSLINVPDADSLDLKRWFGRMGQQVKLLAEQGEDAAAVPAAEIAWRLMAHAAVIDTSGSRWQALRNQLPLETTLPVEPALSTARQQLRGPNTRLLEKVADEVRADLSLVKDGLDLALRAGGLTPEAQTSTAERLVRIANTLSLLGLPQLEQVLRYQSSEIAQLGAGDAEHQGQWMRMATALLRVEYSLESALFRPLRMARTELAAEKTQEYLDSTPHSQDLRESIAALLREMLVDLAKLKAQLDAYLKGGELRDAGEPLLLLSEVAAGLVILDHRHAADLVGRLRDWLRAARPAELLNDPVTAVRFAEAIAATEIYLEALRDALPYPDRVLDTLSAALDFFKAADVLAALDELAPAAPSQEPSPAAEPPEEAAASLAWPTPEASLSIAEDAVPEGHDVPEPSQVVGLDEAAPAEWPAPLAAGDDDPEIRAIFIEEAEEVAEALKRVLPLFHRDPAEPNTLGEIRRAFHTLKGSGRMVGAQRIGEFGWAIEHLLNRCLEGALPVNRAVVFMVDGALQQLPDLLAEFRDAATPAAEDETQALIARAHYLASGRAPEMVEGDVLEVFRADAIDRLADVERWLSTPGADAVDPDAQRALHTLKGSAAVVNAEALSQLAAALEAVLKQLLAADAAAPPEVRAVMAEVLPVLKDWVSRAGQGNPPQGADWLARVEALKPFLPPPGETRSLSHRDALVNLAFDRLQVMEQRLVAWMTTPSDGSLGAAMSDAAEALSIVSQECTPLARGAEAMAERLRRPDIATDLPDAAFFQALTNALEHFYQFLDGYREGGVRETGKVLAGQLLGLPLTALGGNGLPPADAHPVLDDVASEAPPPWAEPAPEPSAIDSLLALTEPHGQPADTAASMDALDTLEVYAIPHEVPVPPESVDAEIAGMFVDEARELIVTLKAEVPAWQTSQEPPETVIRALHTLNGSARMAGYRSLGELAGGFEKRLTGLTAGAASAALIRAELLATLPVLEQAIDAFALMAMPPAAPPTEAPQDFAWDPPFAPTPPMPADPWVLSAQPAAPPPVEAPDQFSNAFMHALSEPPPIEARLLDDGFSDDLAARAPDTPPQIDPPAEAPAYEPRYQRADEPLLQPLPSLLEDMERIDSEGSALGEPVPREKVSTKGIEQLIASNTSEAIDPELANIFIAEAAEMLETIQSSLADWQQDVSDLAAVNELNRALHTLKGGARMTGFMQMGDISHEMESRVAVLLQRGRPLSDEDQAYLKADLETLEHLHDALSRGHYAEAVRVAEPARQVFTSGEEGREDVEFDLPRAAQPVAAPLAESEPLMDEGWEATLFWRPVEDATASSARRELARVPVETLDAMLNEAGEISIYRSRLEQQNLSLVAQLVEMQQTIVRLREQLRLMDIETEAQIAARGLNAKLPGDAPDRYEQDFDPLEMDRYSRMQELSRALAEAVGDLGSLHLSMDQGVNEAQALLLQQGRINSGVQQGLMGTLMVPFSRQVARLQRVVRQTAQEEGKFAEIRFEGVESELDRNVLERMTAPLEHLLRNAVVHGLEDPPSRTAAGKSQIGTVTVSLKREGTQLVMDIADDGKGLDLGAIRRKAIERGLLPVGADLGDDEVARFIFETGFSTAEALTQSAGRGVGMDVVASEVKQLGGSLELRSEAGQGTRFSVRLPLSLAISQALMVQVGEETYALPLVSIEGIGRIPCAVAQQAAGGDEVQFSYAGQDYRVRYLAELIDLPHAVPEDIRTVPAVLVRLGEGVAGGERRAALVVDQLLGNREVVSKAVGPQLSSISGVAGATILPNGDVVLILDPAALVIDRARRRLIAEAAASRVALEKQSLQTGRLVMVVDDSVTMRRVAERLLQRSGYRVLTAKDGLDAIALLQHETPAAILLDIEMPRADGFEVAGFVRNNERISDTPIIMITSRSGDKHRARAATLGVNRYLIKPYQEDQLLHELRALLQAREAEAA